MSDYYPEFYLKKRQREQNYRRATVAVVGIIILFVVAGVAGYFIVNVLTNRQTQPGVTPALADQQQELAVQEKLATSAVPPDVLAATTPAEPVDLSKISYSESMPQVSVALAGAEAAKVEDPAAEETAAESAAEETELPPAAGREPDGGSTAAAAPPTDERVSRVTPSADAEAQRKAEQQQRQEEAKRLAEKREAQKRADEKKRREEAKQQEEAAKPKPTEKKDAEAKPAAKTPSYSYTVYGGTYLSSEAAEADKAKLGALGLSGSIIENAGDYMLLVGKLDDRAGAEALSGKLKGSGFGGAFVTRKAK